MFKKNKKNKKVITIKCVWYNKNAKILNFTKNKPTGGSPVMEKTKKKNKFLVGIYFWIKTMKLVAERWVTV